MPLFSDPSDLEEGARRFGAAFAAAAPALTRPAGDPVTELIAGGIGALGATILDRVNHVQRSAYEMIADRCCPSLRRPIPSATIVAFDPPTSGRYVVPAQSELRSVAIDGVRCVWRPVRPLVVSAFRVTSAQTDVRRGRLTVLRVAVESTGLEPINEAIAGGISLYVDGDFETALQVVYAATSEATAITVEASNWAEALQISTSSVRRIGLEAASALAPDPDGRPATFSAFVDAAVCPDRFRFFRLSELATIESAPPTQRVTISFHLRETSLLEARLRPNDVRAHCAPLVNLFEADAEPLAIDPVGDAQTLRVAGLPRRAGGVYAISYGVATARGGEHPPLPLPDVRRLAAAPADPRCPLVFAASVRDAADEDPDVTVTFGDRGPSQSYDGVRRVAAFRVLATNRSLASRLRPGDLVGEIRTVEESLRYANITSASAYVPAPSGHLFAQRALRAARIATGAHDPLAALRDALFQSIPSWLGREEWIRAQTLRVCAFDRLEVGAVRRVGAEGAVRRGYGYRLVVDESAFRGPGDLALLGATLGEGLARAVPVGAFAELRLEGRRGTFSATFGTTLPA